MRYPAFLACALVVSAPGYIGARVIGTMVPAEPVTEQRVSLLPKAMQPEWRAYLQRSRAMMAADKAALIAERRRGTAPPPPVTGHAGGDGMPLDRPAQWYASAEARWVADNIVSYQTPAGGWGKNQDRTAPPRVPGQMWVPVERLPAEARQDIQSLDGNWVYVGTIDNRATITELRFLARVQSQFPGPDGDPYRHSFLNGVRYLLGAQYPNGGWPQVFPLQGGYHDAVTFNDGALPGVAALLGDVSARQSDYSFVPRDLSAAAGLAVNRAIDLILATQIMVDGQRTIWAQQYDALTLAPIGARNFEPVALSSGESAETVTFLMQLPNPSPAVVRAVDAAIAWFEANAIRDKDWAKATATESRRLVPSAGAKLWARFYDVHSFQPIFGDRDRTIHDDVQDLIPERRNGYAWYGKAPESAIKKYQKWRMKISAAERG